MMQLLTISPSVPVNGVVSSPSNAKNVRVIPESETLNPLSEYAYEAFGFICRTGASRLTYIYRAGEEHVHGQSALYYRHYNELTDEWVNRVEFYSDPTYPVTDAWGGRIDDDKIVVFTATYDDGGTDNSVRTIRLILDLDMNILEDDDVVGVNGVPTADYSWAFGTVQKGDSDGEFYMGFVQIGQAGSSFDYTLSMLKTTDNWVTWSHSVYNDTDNPSTENVAIPCGGSNIMMLNRLDQGGNWQVWTSTNDGGSWTYQGRSTLGTEYTKVKIVTATKNENTGFWDFIFHDRDTEYITASLNNDPSVFFGTATFNPLQVIHHNPTAAITGGLGYASLEYLQDGATRLYCFGKEVSTTKCEIWYSRDNFDKTETAVEPPSLDVFGTPSSTEAVIDFVGYTDDVTDNVDYWTCGLFTDSGFTAAATGKYIASGSAVNLSSFRFVGERIQFSALTTATTYYFRVKAVNDFGESGYTTISFTTA